MRHASGRGLLVMAWCAMLALASACSRTSDPAPSGTVVVLAAASLADAFREIGAGFERANHGVRVEFSFAGSNQLRTQLENGASGEVFASADRAQMDGAVSSSVVDEASVRVFAHNRIVIIVPRENPAGIEGLGDLARPGVKIVVADGAVPVGRYTRTMLERAAAVPGLGATFVEAFDTNTVSHEENVAAVVAKVALNEADAGIAYMTDGAGENGPKLTVIPIDPKLAPQAEYLIAVTAGAADPVIGARFVAYVTSLEGGAVLARFGYSLPETGAP